MPTTLFTFATTITVFLAISWSALSIETYDDYQNPEHADFIEGDIMPDFPTRNGYPNRKWFNREIKYVFSSNFTEAQKEPIRQCCRELANRTCVRCRETIPLDIGFVYFKNEPIGCFSQIGFQHSWYQIINLGPGCLKNYILVCHEIIHALGFDHSHNAYNRDDYVRINFENIKEGQEHNFLKKNDTYDCLVPYDRESTMHYGPFTFSKNGLETITPLDGNYTGMGQRKELRQSDIDKINRMYCFNNCTATTNTTTTSTTTTTTTVPTTTTSEEPTTII
uniref:Metalloendopeptidase n=1 Tax=Musca domestica TaxID=7370 RepID=A0A1I8N6C5_MUSDO